MAKLTLEEKRRQNLKRQLYGKDSFQEVKTRHTTSSKSIHNDQLISAKETVPTSVESNNYFKKDLVKILILSVTAVTIQLALFWALNNHLIKLPISL